MDEQNIDVVIDNVRALLRVGLVLTCEDKILLVIEEEKDFLGLPSGRVQAGESTEDAIQREIKEELDCKIDGVELGHIAENFAVMKNGRTLQEVFFVYYADIDKNHPLAQKQDFLILDAPKEKCHWFEMNDLKNHKIKKGLRDFLVKGKKGISHLVTK